MNMCQIVTGVDVAFHQILDGILKNGPSSSLGKLEESPMIKSKPYGSKK
jgi:hypothetical protein